jgi:hypothetical protein
MIIDVVTPGNGKTYELILDGKLTVGIAKEKIIEQITAFENDNIAFDENVALFSPMTKDCLPDYRNLRKAGVRSGQTLYLL